MYMAGHRFKPENAHKLHSAERLKLLPPEKIIQSLGATPEDVIADLGAGSGYFTIPFAQQTKQTVYAVDIEPKMLEFVKERATAEQIENIQYVVSDLEQIQLADHTVDKINAAFVLHEVVDLDNAIEEMKRILKPDGKAIAIEWINIETESGPPLHERIAAEKLAETFCRHGFEASISYPNDVHYIITLTHI